MYRIRTLNNISTTGLDRLSRDRYEVGGQVSEPDGILVRSHDMHGMALPPSLKAVGRAGVGVNNIPVEALGARGVPVFNTPGANANAVKELVLAGMLIAARNVCQAWAFVRGLDGPEDELESMVESAKKRFAGFELPGRTLGVIGLGAVGVQVANAAVALGMRVAGHDPQISVERAWQLASAVEQAPSVADLIARADFVSVHVPLVEQTRHLIDAARIESMRQGAVLLNFSRDAVVDSPAVLAALESGRLHAYVCDFPAAGMKDHERVIALPHIGASTREAEDNCAIMVVEQMRDYLEDGTIRNSINFPDVYMPRIGAGDGEQRLALVNANVPNMLGQISTALARAGLNIVDMLNKSRGSLAYTLTDVSSPVPRGVVDELAAIDGVMSVRAL